MTICSTLESLEGKQEGLGKVAEQREQAARHSNCCSQTSSNGLGLGKWWILLFFSYKDRTGVTVHLEATSLPGVTWGHHFKLCPSSWAASRITVSEIQTVYVRLATTWKNWNLWNKTWEKVFSLFHGKEPTDQETHTSFASKCAAIPWKMLISTHLLHAWSGP